MKNLLVATKNAGKLREIRRHLEPFGIEALGLDAFPGSPEVIEDKASFRENALLKAESASRYSGLCSLADDSGLVVHALDGRPGVYSARYAGCGASDQQNNAKLLEEMKNIEDDLRSATFHCSLVFCCPGSTPHVFEGRVDGYILREERGQGGFGYDPLFWLVEHQCTMAEMPVEEKNGISHRGQALQKFLNFLVSFQK